MPYKESKGQNSGSSNQALPKYLPEILAAAFSKNCVELCSMVSPSLLILHAKTVAVNKLFGNFGQSCSIVHAKIGKNGKMTGLDKATDLLRESVLMGRFTPEEKIGENTVAEQLGVSRTLARLAMGALEREGLLAREPRRGFRVKSFSLADIAGAIEVRGELESMAVRILAETGLTAEQIARLRNPIIQSEEILGHGTVTLQNRLRWTEMNLEFHEAIIAETKLEALRMAFDQVNRLPLVSPLAIVFDMADPVFSRPQLERAQQDHLGILDAIIQRKSSRAAALMREHSVRSGENKRRSLENMTANDQLISMPGAALIDIEKGKSAG